MLTSTLVYLFGAVFVVLAIAAYARSEKKVLGFGKGWVGTIFLLLGAFLIVGQMGYLPSGISFSVDSSSPSGSGNTQTGIASTGGNYQPTATYSTKDTFASTVVSGTSYYKANSLPATTTAYTNVNPNDQVQYWVDNSSYYVQPQTVTTGNGVNPIVAQAFLNGTVTVDAFDTVARLGANTSARAGGSTPSMAANKQATIEFDYTGTNKQSAMPFGGAFVVEQNATITSVLCTGADLLASNPYQVTYTVSSTANSYKVFGVANTIDTGAGTLHAITCQYQNGATAAGAGAAYYAKWIPANYYVTQTGNIVLDTENKLNQGTTRQGKQTPTVTAYWGS